MVVHGEKSPMTSDLRISYSNWLCSQGRARGNIADKRGTLDSKKLEGNGPVEPVASRAIEDKHVVQ